MEGTHPVLETCTGTICEMAVQTSSLVKREVSCSFISGVTFSGSTSRHSSTPVGSDEKTRVIVIQEGTTDLWGTGAIDPCIIQNLTDPVGLLSLVRKQMKELRIPVSILEPVDLGSLLPLEFFSF
jgi:hypothetical protein